MTISRLVFGFCVVLLSFPSLVFAAKTHKVKKNESFVIIAKKYHVSVADLKAANNIVNPRVKSGTVLVIPPRSESAKADVSDNETERPATFKVRRADTLARIAKRTGVSVAELKRLNGLGKGRLKPGTILVLRETGRDAEPAVKVAHKPSLRYADLLNDKEYEKSLTDLMEKDLDQNKAVDLSSNIELKTDNAKLLKSAAYGFLGTRYRVGGTGRSGLDCSAFVQKVFLEMDVKLPRTAREQFEEGQMVSPGDLKKGDLVFFRTYASFPSHVGIYLGNNRMIHASSRDRRVVISAVNTPYYRARYIGAKRIAKIAPDTFNLDELVKGVDEEIEQNALDNDSSDVSLISN